jgi:protein arginine N-methyltransferase 1
MASDGTRMEAYARAIARVVTPGSVVVDLGAGTGICSLLAARAGARQVHAIEANPAVWMLREIAAENGMADRIIIHPRPSSEVNLGERADVIISDLRGAFPLIPYHLATVHDARERFLKPGGTLLPLRDHLFVAAVDGHRLGRALDDDTRGFELRGLSASAVATALKQQVHVDHEGELRMDDLLSSSAHWATIEYGTMPATFDGRVELVGRRRGIVSGLAVWFEATIIEGVTFENPPGSRMAYARSYLPLLEPLTLDEGDRLGVELRVDQHGGRWAWDTTMTTRAGERKARFRQSTFLGMPTSPEALKRASPKYVPKRSPHGERTARILELMDGTRSIDEIATQLEGEATPPAKPRLALLDEIQHVVERYAG